VNALKQHRSFFILLCFAATLFLSDIQAYKEFVRAESYFALGAKLMIEDGNWLTPHAPDELPLNKPPLTYWLIGISYKLFGVSYGASRLPSVLAALATLVLVYFLGTTLANKRNGLVAAAILGTSYLFMNFARMAMSEMLLTFFVTASLSAFIVALTSHGVRPNRLVYLGYVALALGILTKGPVALALVVLPITLDLLITRQRDDFRRLQVFRGLALLVVIAAPYFLLVYLRAGSEPLQFFFLGENLKRFTGQIYGNSGRPIWYEFAALFSDFAPWSWLLPVAAWIDWKARREKEPTRPRRLLYLWLGVALLLFSASSFKLDYYLLPIMPAAALIVAPAVSKASDTSQFVRRLNKFCLALTAIAVLAVSLVSLRAAEVLGVHSSLRLLPLVVAAIGIGAIGYCIVRHRTLTTALMLCLVITVTMLSLELTLLPAFTRFLPARELVSAVPGHHVWFTSPAAADWANDLQFNLPVGSKVERLIGDEAKLLQTLRDEANAVVLIQEREYAKLAERDGTLKILSRAETFGHGGLRLKMLRHPERESLFVIGR
jgi:4-amino-4-deoxy-L-arabinose transferase-like glycosyltransferase